MVKSRLASLVQTAGIVIGLGVAGLGIKGTFDNSIYSINRDEYTGLSHQEIRDRETECMKYLGVGMAGLLLLGLSASPSCRTSEDSSRSRIKEVRQNP